MENPSGGERERQQESAVRYMFAAYLIYIYRHTHVSILACHC